MFRYIAGKDLIEPPWNLTLADIAEGVRKRFLIPLDAYGQKLVPAKATKPLEELVILVAWVAFKEAEDRKSGGAERLQDKLNYLMRRYHFRRDEYGWPTAPHTFRLPLTGGDIPPLSIRDAKKRIQTLIRKEIVEAMEDPFGDAAETPISDFLLSQSLLGFWYLREEVEQLQQSLTAAPNAAREVTEMPIPAKTGSPKTRTKSQIRWDRATQRGLEMKKENPRVILDTITEDPILLSIWPKSKRPKNSYLKRKLQGTLGLKPGRR